jgi:hypothetical protein
VNGISIGRAQNRRVVVTIEKNEVPEPVKPVAKPVVKPVSNSAARLPATR